MRFFGCGFSGAHEATASFTALHGPCLLAALLRSLQQATCHWRTGARAALGVVDSPSALLPPTYDLVCSDCTMSSAFCRQCCSLPGHERAAAAPLQWQCCTCCLEAAPLPQHLARQHGVAGHALQRRTAQLAWQGRPACTRAGRPCPGLLPPPQAPPPAVPQSAGRPWQPRQCRAPAHTLL